MVDISWDRIQVHVNGWGGPFVDPQDPTRSLMSQREAMQANRGVWQQSPSKKESFYLGNKNSLSLHRPTCPMAATMSPANRVRFSSPQEAYLKGYSPCRSCKP